MCESLLRRGFFFIIVVFGMMRLKREGDEVVVEEVVGEEVRVIDLEVEK